MKTILFFYGSLKRGYSNHHRVRGEFLGEAATTQRYRIIQLGEYGGLVRDDANGFAVKGELWAVDERCLAELDAFETGEGLWARQPVAVQGHEGAESYFWSGDVPANVHSSDFWPFA